MLILPTESTDALSAFPFRDIHVDGLPLNGAASGLVLFPGDLQELIVSDGLDKPVAEQRQRESQRADVFPWAQLANRFRTHGSKVDERTWSDR